MVICIIPARYGSSRLPGKPLADVAGKPLIQWVYEKARASSLIRETWVATDDRRIFDAVQSFGGKALMTTGEYLSGTDRIADAALEIPGDIICNLQGDEPGIHPETLDQTIRALLDNPDFHVSTAMVGIQSEKDYRSPAVVKVVCTPDGTALFFSRSPIPSLVRAGNNTEWEGFFGFKHLGLYVFRRETLLAFPKMKPGFLERLEQLEQLRFMENGYRIRVVQTVHDSVGVDTPEDLEELRAEFQKGI